MNESILTAVDDHGSWCSGKDETPVLRYDSGRVRVAPNWDVYVQQSCVSEGPRISIDIPGCAPDVGHLENNSASRSIDAMFPGGITEMDLPPAALRDPVELAIHIAALIGCSVLHECLEWIHVDGKRLAEPHPNDAGPSWDDLIAGCRRGLRAHIRKHPVQEARP